MFVANGAQPSTGGSQSSTGGASTDAGVPEAGGTVGASGSPSSVDTSSGPVRFEYREVDGSVCANGTPAGIGLAPVVGSEQLVIFFNGGGACWDAVSCFGLNGATHLSTTYSQAALDVDVAPLTQSGLADRSRTDTPFAGASMAFLPYCTADLFAGDAVRQVQADLLGLDLRSVHHKGRPNAVAFIDALAAEFPDVTEVHVVGVSAGGFGAVLSYDLLADAFASASVDLLIDGAPFVPPLNGLYATWQNQWNMQLPDCEGCDTDFTRIVDDLRQRVPERRFALLTSTNDEVIRTYFGYGVSDMTAATTAVVETAYSHDNARAFVVLGTQHVLLGGYDTWVAPNGVSLKDFVDGWAVGDDRFVGVPP